MQNHNFGFLSFSVTNISKMASGIEDKLIRNFACIFIVYIFDRIGSQIGFWVFVMIKLFLNPWNGISIAENHTFVTKIIKISWLITKLWWLPFLECVWQPSWKYAN